MDKKPDIFDKIMLLPPFKKLYPFYAKYKEIIMYLFFGFLTFLVSFLGFALLHGILCINELIANIISSGAAMVFAYVTNRIWVFSRSDKKVIIEFLEFISARIFTLLAEELIIYIFITRLSFNSLIVKAAAQIVVIVLNYILSKTVIFSRKT